jgi:phage N-6-adenine-methyltransferase
MTTPVPADQTYGALGAYLQVAGDTLEHAFQRLETLIAGDGWRQVSPGFDDINVFMNSIRLDRFKAVADQRQKMARRIKELQSEVTNRQIARTLGVDHQTINNDLAGENSPPAAKEAKEISGPPDGAGENSPTGHSFNSGASYTGDPEWHTPPEHVERARRVLGGIDLDPASNAHAQEIVQAAQFFTKDEDGLKQQWAGRVFLNPPYAQPTMEQFVDKLLAEVQSGRVSAAILLINSFTGTKWFCRAAKAAAAICFTTGRIRFESPDGDLASPALGQLFFYFGDDPTRFAEAFGQVGPVCPGPIAAPA